MNTILPYILVFLTRKSRYKPELIWSDSFISNVFRVYEFFFWRRYGIRKESTTIHNDHKIIRYFHTIESILVHFEYLLRNIFVWKPFRIYIPMIATPMGQIPASPYLFAIAFDATASGAYTGTSPLTFSHTVTGSNPFLAIGSGASGISVPTTTAVSYNSVAATRAQSNIGSGDISGALETSVWFLGNPSTGSNTVSVSFTGATTTEAGVVSYSGAQSNNIADASGGTNGTADGAQTFTVTTVADNCWVFGTAMITSVLATLTSSAQTERWNVSNGTTNVQAGQDTNTVKTPAGSVTMGWTTGGTVGGGTRWAMSGASFAPFSTTVIIHSFLLMGVGS